MTTNERFTVTDDDGDTVEVSRDLCEEVDADVVLLRVTNRPEEVDAEPAEVFVSLGDLRALLDAAEEITGLPRPERMLPDVDEPRKATDAPPVLWSPDRQALVEGAKDLLRRATGDLDGDLVVFLGGES